MKAMFLRRLSLVMAVVAALCSCSSDDEAFGDFSKERKQAEKEIKRYTQRRWNSVDEALTQLAALTTAHDLHSWLGSGMIAYVDVSNGKIKKCYSTYGLCGESEFQSCYKAEDKQFFYGEYVGGFAAEGHAAYGAIPLEYDSKDKTVYWKSGDAKVYVFDVTDKSALLYFERSEPWTLTFDQKQYTGELYQLGAKNISWEFDWLHLTNSKQVEQYFSDLTYGDNETLMQMMAALTDPDDDSSWFGFTPPYNGATLKDGAVMAFGGSVNVDLPTAIATMYFKVKDGRLWCADYSEKEDHWSIFAVETSYDIEQHHFRWSVKDYDFETMFKRFDEKADWMYIQFPAPFVGSDGCQYAGIFTGMGAVSLPIEQGALDKTSKKKE